MHLFQSLENLLHLSSITSDGDFGGKWKVILSMPLSMQPPHGWLKALTGSTKNGSNRWTKCSDENQFFATIWEKNPSSHWVSMLSGIFACKDPLCRMTSHWCENFPELSHFWDFTWARKFYVNTSQIVQTLTIWHSAHENSPVDRHANRSRVASRRNYDKLLTIRCFVTQIMKMTAAKHWSKCKALSQMPECSSTHWQKCIWLQII